MSENREIAGKVGYANPPVHTRFKKGVSGNPKGYPEGQKNRSTILRQLFDVELKHTDFEGKEVIMTAEQKMLVELVKKGFGGDVQATREALDSVYGKVPNKVEGSVGLTVIHQYTAQPGNDPLDDE